MEAAPRLPMLFFDLKTCTENAQFGPVLKQYIAAFYNEDPDSYQTEIHNLEMLRASAVRPSKDVNGVQLLKKYYCQLHFLKSRFPMEENQDAAVQFSWKDAQVDMCHSSNDIRFELMVIMFNIGALHTILGANDSRSNPEGMKLACTHFQCAAWAFQCVKEKYNQFVGYLSTVELVHFFQQVCLAQAQECILEKSMLDNRKATIIAKVAVQVHSYYRQSLNMLEYPGDDMIRDKTYQEWTRYLHFKKAYYKCIALLYQGQQAEEQQKMGERVAYYQAACEQLEEAKKYANTLKNKKPEINEGLAFTQDVVEGKRKAAKNENEFIYHEEVPKIDQLEEVKGASLVKGIGFSINDTEVSGPDIFARLVPMEAHEAASLYSEKKAQMLRSIGELIDSKDQELAEFMSSLQLEVLTKMHQATGIPQDIVDRAAALDAKPTAITELESLMEKLSTFYNDVDTSLKEIDTLLKEEEIAEKNYQEVMGKRPPSIIATDLSREAAKYKEAHVKAHDSNQTLQKAMIAHISNLKVLQQPLRTIQQQLPSVVLPNPNIDEHVLRELESLAAKVEEMRNQRAMLWAQLRESVHKDDITNSLVTKQPNQSLEQLFQQELEKHQHLISLIEQNTAAQANIRQALVDTYAKATATRKYVMDIINKRNFTVNALVASCDTYDDVLSKALKGVDFYTKLETNVSKLLQRIKSACKVQQEERDQMLLKNDIPKIDVTGTTPAAPKLKDYLENRKKNSNINNPSTGYNDPSMQYQQQLPNMGYNMNPNMELPPGIRPTPLGSEITDAPKSSSNEPSYSYPNNMQHDYNRQGQTGYSQYSQYYQQQVPASVEQDLVNRMNNIMSNSNPSVNNQQHSQQQRQAYQQQYSTYIPQNYSPATTYAPTTQPYTSIIPTNAGYSFDTTKAFTTTIDSYRPLSSTTLPNISTTHMQYPDSSLNEPGSNDSNPSANYPSYSSTGYTVPTQTTTPSGVQNVNTYYPMGYGPNYTGTHTENTQHLLPGELQYHSLQYATSVQGNTGHKSLNATYSSPIPNLTSAPARDQSTVVAINTNYDAGYQNVAGGTTQNAQPVYGYETDTSSYQASTVPTSSALHAISSSTTGYSADSAAYTSQNISYPTSSTSYANQASYPTAYTNASAYASGTTTYPTAGGYSNYQAENSGYDQSGSTARSFYPSATPGIGQSYTGESSAAQNSSGYSYGVGGMGMTPGYPLSGTPQDYRAASVSPAPGVLAGAGGYVGQSLVSDTSNHNMVSTPTLPQQQTGQTGVDAATYAAYYGQAYAQSYAGYVPDISATNQQVPQPQSIPSVAVPTTTKESNIDLLSGLDFSINQAPLVPQQNLPAKEEPEPTEVKPSTTTSPVPTVKEDTASGVQEIKRPVIKVLPSKPLNNNDVKNLCNTEIDKYEKYVETLTNKTLSGPTNLDIKWKEIQDKQDNDSQKKIISVARCYPMKNRFPDILPYDHSRIELQGTKDDYINASYVKNVSLYAPCFIVTQAPLSSTFGDFWTMIKEQQVELIFCLLNDNEIGEDIYWPKEKGQSLSFLNMVITLQSTITKSHWVERLISISVPEKRENWMVMHLQFTSWPGSLFPNSPEPFLSYVLELVTLFQQQRSNTHPVVVHCASGIGRSGLVCLLTIAFFDMANNANSIPDLAALTSKLTNCRKNILRNREHLKFAYECMLAYMKQMVTQDKMKKKLNELVPKPETESSVQSSEVVEKNIDPLSTLDPFWASKK